jgi:hypothetical protein
MIHELDESIRRLVLRDALPGSGVEVTFDAPTKEWAVRRNAPTLNIYFYDIREDLQRRQVEYEDIRDDAGHITARRAPPRRFRLSYLVTAWTQRPEDEHRVLDAVLGCFLQRDALPTDVLAGSLGEQRLAVIVEICLPPPEDRNLSDVWSALGGELKPSLDLVIIAPFDANRIERAAPLVLEEPRVTLVSPAGAERGRGRARRKRRDEQGPRRVAEETFTGGTDTQPGRTFRVRGTADE